MLKLITYYILIFTIIGFSIILPFFLSPGAVIVTLIFLVVLVVIFLFNYGFVFIPVIYLIVYVGAVLVLYLFAISLLRERLNGFYFKVQLFLYFLPTYVILILLYHVLIVDTFENLDFFSFDFSRIGLSSGVISNDYIFYNMVFSKYSEITNISVLLFYKYLVLFVCCGILLFIVLIGSLSVLSE